MAAGDDGVGAEDGEEELDGRTHQQEHDDVGRCFREGRYKATWKREFKLPGARPVY